MTKTLNILGIRGIPAAHGGFESFVQNFAPFMHNKGWAVVVYCQHDSRDPNTPKSGSEDIWQGIRRVHISVPGSGPLSTILFDLKATLNVLNRPGIDLVLGYNTAIFIILQRIFRRTVLINMDGIEWHRRKWGRYAKVWFWANEWLGLKLASVPIADHPEIAKHLYKRGCKESIVIPYGAHRVTDANKDLIAQYNLAPRDYFISIARIEPENSLLEIVQAYTKSGVAEKLIILGNFSPEQNQYHRAIQKAANSNVVFLGAIYEIETVQSLRFHSLAYIHGHQVGGTNPSLVEALGAGNIIIAHDNKFNRWTAGRHHLYFSNIIECAEAIIKVTADVELRNSAHKESLKLHDIRYRFEIIHSEYLSVISNSSGL
ncbi:MULTISPECIES: DUF1972 domain-containing protein [unclassified Rhizobium]|uniref:DUF1972 domain-containing protein n=1 Tax=unclassified Rhizobium TaxID=2613769 RepID=UPI0009EAB0B4|nr:MULTISPECIES: DUF1972 domain-containing protein [unclassified Rhizobium]